MFWGLWENVKLNKKYKRNVKEVNFSDINLNEYIILDVRSRREYKEGHLNGAINIPLSEIKKNAEQYVPYKQRKILIYCQYGVRSKKAVELLIEKGYINVYNLKGGLENI
jgi:rhodanese-related sulfurtransferase